VLSQAGEQAHLSIRETEVLAAIASGMSTREIARQLGVAERTVDTHRERRHQKLGAHNVADLTREAVRRGLVRLM
jgi:DNA-binding CsgD family transcriptional regulator